MRKLVAIVVVLLILIMALVAVLPFVIPVDTYKAEVARLVKEQTGRDLAMNGPVRASVFPTLGLTAEQVTLSNPEGFSKTPFAEVRKLRVEVALKPLLSKRVEVERFVLEQPIIRLEVNKAGTPNWEFKPAASSARPAEYKPSYGIISSAEAQAAAPSALSGLQLGEVRVSDGTVTYRDVRAKQGYELKKVNLALSFPDMSSPLALKGDAEWNGRPVSLTLNVKAPNAVLAGKESPAELKLQSGDLVQVMFSGNVTQTGAQGRAEFGTPSIPKLAAWAGAPMEWKGATPLAFGFRGPIACTTTRCAVTETDFVLDALRLNGSVAAGWGGAKPLIEARLSTPELDINPYLPQKPRASLSLISSAYAATGGGWSMEPMDLSGLLGVNANVNLTANAVKYEKLSIGKTILNAELAGGVLQMSLPEVQLYGGTARGNATINAAAKPYAIEKQFTVNGVKAGPFLKDLSDFDRLEGTLAFEIKASGRGISQQQIVSNLNGAGRVMFTDGAIKGVNLAQLIRDIKGAVTLQEQSGSQQTDFSELGGTFTITNGILSNNDLAMKAPLLRLKGAGTVDLPQQYVNYRLSPELVGSLKGQGGKDKEGLGIPVIVEGTFDRLTFRPDFESAAREALKDPEKAKETVKNVRDQIREIKKDPDGVKNLLKGLGR